MITISLGPLLAAFCCSPERSANMAYCQRKIEELLGPKNEIGAWIQWYLLRVQHPAICKRELMDGNQHPSRILNGRRAAALQQKIWMLDRHLDCLRLSPFPLVQATPHPPCFHYPRSIQNKKHQLFHVLIFSTSLSTAAQTQRKRVPSLGLHVQLNQRLLTFLHARLCQCRPSAQSQQEKKTTCHLQLLCWVQFSRAIKVDRQRSLPPQLG